MGFRRSDDDEAGSSRWRRRHRARLLACGLPLELLESDRTLSYVLFHGDDPASGWNASWLSDEQAEQLLAFLTEVIPNATAFDLIAELQRRRARRA